MRMKTTAIAKLFFVTLLVLAPSITLAYAQQTKKTSVDYIENARSLLKQVSTEYKNGNYARAEELAGTAYLDNFEHVEADLQKQGQSELVEDLEKMMVTDLRGMIRDKVSQDQLDAQISDIDAKLSQAIAIVPEFPIGTTAIILSAIIGSMIVGMRIKGRGSII